MDDSLTSFLKERKRVINNYLVDRQYLSHKNENEFLRKGYISKRAFEKNKFEKNKFEKSCLIINIFFYYFPCDNGLLLWFTGSR